MHFNLADLFECVVDAVPDREAVVCGGRRLTFAHLCQRSNDHAATRGDSDTRGEAAAPLAAQRVSRVD